MTKIKTGDTVRVMSGSTEKGKGKEGKVLKVDSKKGKVLVEGINKVKRHSKPSAQNPQGGLVKQEAPIHISNLMLVDPKSGDPTRVSIKHEGKNVIRISKKSGEVIK